MRLKRPRSQGVQIRDGFRIDLHANAGAAETLTYTEELAITEAGVPNIGIHSATSARLMLPA